MSKLEFTKMQGAGNDFIVLDLRRRKFTPAAMKSLMKKLSDRKFGIGFDQALILKTSKKSDFTMEIYNFDGSKVEMCGNGIRCFANYIWSRGLSKKKVLEIETMAGIIRPEKAGKLVKVDMGEPILEAKKIPTTVKNDTTLLDYPIKLKDGSTHLVTTVSMGNPHAVVFVKDVDNFDVHGVGVQIENHKLFPKRINVEFIEVKSKSRLKMRVWERGTGETLACGTGACAAQVASFLHGKTNRTATLELLGGNLNIEWNKLNNRVYMTGPAEEVFTGTVNI